jgi:hypothetical protein
MRLPAQAAGVAHEINKHVGRGLQVSHNRLLFGAFVVTETAIPIELSVA